MARVTGTKKTEPSVRDEASEDLYAKEFLVQVDDSSNVPDELIESNKLAVKLEAEQRGLRATGEATLKSKEVKDARNVLLTYTLRVKSAEAK
jgi:hypothetical protein